MQEPSSRASPTQPSPRPSSSLTSSHAGCVTINESQVEVLNRALSTAKVLGRVRRECLATSEPPVARQILERTLKKNLNRRLSQISLTSSPQGSSLDIQVTQPIPLPHLEHHSPRTSSPLNLTLSHHLAPGTPTSPSTSFDSVFFQDRSELPPIQPPILPLPSHEADLSVTPNPSEPLPINNTMAELEELEKGLKTLSRKIPALIGSNPPSILTEVEMIPLYVDSERKLVDMMVELDIGLQEIFEDYAVQLGDTKINSWKAKLVVIKNQLSSFRQEIAAKIKDLKQSSNAAQQSPQVSPSMSNNSTVNTSLEQDRLNFDRDKQRKQEERLQTEAETRMNAVIEDTKKFGSKFPSMAEDWTLEDNIKIETAMKEISNWEKMMSRLKKEAREVEIIVKGNSLADTQGMVQTMQALMTMTEKCMDNSIRQVQYLDSSRNLNTLGTRRAELVKLPQFSGKSGEDFLTFKKKMEKAFSSNRIPTDDQVEKLCENLRDGAKLVVPDGTDDVERAWDILQAAYGGEDKVMQNRKDKLSSLGSLPEAGVLNKGGQSKRITWCLELERLLSEIVELGNRNDGLAKEAFSKSTINIVIGMFPPDIRKDMIKVRSEGSDKLLEIIEIIEAERAIFQEDEQFIAKKPQGRHHQRDGGGGGGVGGETDLAEAKEQHTLESKHFDGNVFNSENSDKRTQKPSHMIFRIE